MKDAYWFKHDANARHDAKLVALRTTEGMCGIGRYWCLIEILREQADYELDLSLDYVRIVLVKELEFDSEEQLDKYLHTLIKLHLVEIHDTILSCSSLRRRMEQLDEVRARRSEAGRTAGQASAEAKRQRQSNDRSTTVKQTSTNVQRISTTLNHISTDLSTQLIDSPINQSTDVSARKNLPDTQPVQAPINEVADLPYSVEIAYNEIPLGFAFKPKELLDTPNTFIKMSDTEFYDQTNRRAMKYTGSGETTVFIKPLEAIF